MSYQSFKRKCKYRKWHASYVWDESGKNYCILPGREGRCGGEKKCPEYPKAKEAPCAKD